MCFRKRVGQTQQVWKAGEKSEKRDSVFRLADQIAHAPLSHTEVVSRLLEIYAVLAAEAHAQRYSPLGLLTIVFRWPEVDRDLAHRLADERQLPLSGSHERIEANQYGSVRRHDIERSSPKRVAQRIGKLHRLRRKLRTGAVAEID